jgi:hypothetical protein
MKLMVSETEDPTLYRLPLITSGLYIFCAYLHETSPINLNKSNSSFSNC